MSTDDEKFNVTGSLGATFTDPQLFAATAKAAQVGGTEVKLHVALAMAGCEVHLIDGPEFDAIVAGLRFLAREVEAGNVVYPHDEIDIGDIWTNAGEHEGLPAEDIHKLADRLLGN